MRVYCGLASAGRRIPVAVVDGAGRLLARHEVDDTPTGYATLLSLLSEGHRTEPARAVMATDSETNLLPLLLAAAGEPLAVADTEVLSHFAAEDSDPNEPHGRALALARALQAGVLPATTRPAPRDLAALRPVLTAHRVAVAGRVTAVAMLRDLLRELYPAALMAFPDPGTPLALAVLDRLADPAEVAESDTRGVVGQLRTSGHSPADVEVAVDALRRAITVTSARAARSHIVAATVRHGVTAVRAADSAAAGLVDVIAERVEPRTSGRGFRAVPPVSGPPISGVPFSAPPVSGPPISGPPMSGVPATASAGPSQLMPLMPLAEAHTAEQRHSAHRLPSGQPAMAKGPSGFTPPRSEPAARPTDSTSPITSQQSRVRQAPAVPPPIPHQPTASDGGRQTRGYPAIDRTNGYPTTGLSSSGFPTSGFPVAGLSPSNGRSSNGTSPTRYGERDPLTDPVLPSDQADDELYRLTPDELPGSPSQHQERPPRYTEPISGQLAALIEFPRSGRRQATGQYSTSQPEQPRRDAESHSTGEYRSPQPARQRAAEAPAPSPPIGDGDGDLLIFAQARSAWFTGDEDESGEANWRSEADKGWDAAAAASQPTVGGATRSGLPRRVPSANLVPGAAPHRERNSEHPINRDAAQLAAHTAGYFRGWNRARQDAEEQPYHSARHR